MDKRRKRTNVLIRRITMLIISICTLILFVLCVILLKRVSILEEKVENLSGTLAVMQTEEIVEPVPQVTIDIEPFSEKASKSETETAAAESGTESAAETMPGLGGTEAESEAEDLRKQVFLTFDDGPSRNTDLILDILKEYDVKATFFVIGKTDEASKAAYKRIVEEGHTLGMHSYSHAYDEVYASREAFEEDLIRLQNYLFEVTGVMSGYYRFPGGSSNTISTIDMQEFISCLHEHGVEYFDWNVSSGDGTSGGLDTETMLENVMKDLVKFQHSVVLMHDDVNKNQTVEFLRPLIETLTEQDCVILPIDDNVQPVQHLRPEV